MRKRFLLTCFLKAGGSDFFWFDTEEELTFAMKNNTAIIPYQAFEIGDSREIDVRPFVDVEAKREWNATTGKSKTMEYTKPHFESGKCRCCGKDTGSVNLRVCDKCASEIKF